MAADGTQAYRYGRRCASTSPSLGDDREAARRERPFRRPLTHRGRHHQALPVDEHARAHGVRPGCISWPTPRLAGGRSPLIARATRHEDLTRPEFISEIEQVHREALKQNVRRTTVSASPSCSGKSRTSWMPSPPVNCAGLLRSLAVRNQRSIPRVHTLLDRWRVRGPDVFDRPPVVPGEPRESVDATCPGGAGQRGTSSLRSAASQPPGRSQNAPVVVEQRRPGP